MGVTCKRCLEMKSINDFYTRPTKTGNRIFRRVCKKCHNQETKERSKTVEGRLCRKSNQMRYDCGVSSEEYNYLFYEQGGNCAICGCPETSTSKTGEVKRLCIDHNHESGIIRGLLCQKCNTAVGLMNDDIEVFKSAINYLQQTGQQRSFAGKRLVVKSVIVGLYTS